jgi:hypothetical protein
MTDTETLTFTDRILAAYVSASDDDIAEGMQWYVDALALATELDPTNIRRAVGIFAVLSPLTSWPQNVIKSRMLYATGDTYGLPDSVAKAKRILAGEDAESVISGPKVTSFYWNIMGDNSRVTVDRHAIDVAYGRVMTDKERGNAVKRTKARDGYAILKNAYSIAADILSAEQGRTISGAQLQAIVWVWWRKNHAQAYHSDK